MNQPETQKLFAQPSEAKAALYFLEAHYQLSWREGSIEKTKFLSPQQIGKAFTMRDEMDSGWLETGVLRFARGGKTNKILSVLPAGRRKILVTNPHSSDEYEDDNENTPDAVIELEVPLPSLLLLGFGQQFFLWATLDKEITQTSKICAAPFPNLDDSGKICFGGNTAPECRLDTIEKVWQIIFESPFNNHQAADRCRTHKQDVRKLLLEINGKNKFPNGAIIKTDYTIADLWNSIG